MKSKMSGKRAHTEATNMPMNRRRQMQLNCWRIRTQLKIHKWSGSGWFMAVIQLAIIKLNTQTCTRYKIYIKKRLVNNQIPVKWEKNCFFFIIKMQHSLILSKAYIFLVQMARVHQWHLIEIGV